MVQVKRLVLDVLKPHSPTSLDLAKALGEISPGYQVSLRVEEVDEKTETICLEISAEAIDFDAVEEVIGRMGAALHSIDEVDVENDDLSN